MKKESILFLLFALLLFGCASVMNPEGGPKDISGPKIVKTIPDSATVLFNSNKITWIFDEFINVNNPSQEWTISPTPQKFPEIKKTYNKLEIKLLDSLLPNTTYTIETGKSIVDLNEANPLENYRFVFATGNILDSLSLKGKVLKSKSQEPLKEITVILTDTSSSLLSPVALYAVKTGEDGSFIFHNLPNKAYHILAIDDKNKNKKPDVDEEIAFLNSPVNPDTNLYILQSFKPFYGNQFIKSIQQNKNGLFQFVLNQPHYYQPTTINTTIDQTKAKNIINSTGDTVLLSTYYNNNTDSIAFQIILPDTQYTTTVATSKYRDTLYLINNQEIKQSKKIVKLNFSQALSNYKTENISLLNALYSPLKIDSIQLNLASIFIYSSLLSDGHYTIILRDSAVKSLFNKYTNKSDSLRLTIEEDFNTGSLEFKVEDTLNRNKIISLVSEYKTVQSQICDNCRTVKFDYINPGTYQVLIQIDENKNGFIDNGSILQHQIPEKTYLLIEPYKVKSNWQQTDIQLIIPY